MIKRMILAALSVALTFASATAGICLFGPPRTYYVGTVEDPYVGGERGQNRILFGDFDGDGAIDIFVVNSKVAGAASILYGTAGGIFEPRRDYFSAEQSTAAARVPEAGARGAAGAASFESDHIIFDSNGDGFDDIAEAVNWDVFFVRLSDGARGWTTGPNGYYGSNRTIKYLLGTTDCNHDNVKDVIGYCESKSTPTTGSFVFFQYGNGSYAGATEMALPAQSTRHPVGDFNLNGVKDCIGTHSMSQGVITPYYGSFSCGFTGGTTWDDLGTSEMVVGDFNGDYYADLAYTRLIMEMGCAVFFVPGSGSGLREDEMTWGSWLSENPYDAACDGRICAADFNDDHLTDMAVSDGRFYATTGRLPVYLHYSVGETFSDHVDTLIVRSSRLACPFAADFNDDGRADLCFLTTPDSLTVYLSDVPIGVRLKSFDVRFDPLRGTVLSWEVSGLIDEERFSVSRALGAEDLEYIGEVEAHYGRVSYEFVDAEISPGAARTATYRLDVEETDGSWTTLASEIVPLPEPRFALHQNYPNPFNPITVIPFELPYAEIVRLEVYDVSGALVKCLVPGRLLGPGAFFEKWDGTNSNGERVSSGIYYCRLRAGKYDEKRTMIVLR